SQNRLPLQNQPLAVRCPAVVRSVDVVPVTMLSFLDSSPTSIHPAPPPICAALAYGPAPRVGSHPVKDTGAVAFDCTGRRRLSLSYAPLSLFKTMNVPPFFF
ncbi:hypothetical protein A2U01_0063290, partial [Trifolium medium]|nr:hypothetical protein [Trifolium medium]